MISFIIFLISSLVFQKKDEKKIEDIAFIFYEYSISLCLKIGHLNNKILKYLLLLICSPYVIIRCLFLIIYETTIGSLIIKRKIREDRKTQFKYLLSIVAIVKDEAPYIREWVSYYLVACNYNVHFYIYDNGSEDGTKNQISDFISKGYITYIDFPGVKMQLPAYEKAIKDYKDETKYMAFIDADEFIVATNDNNLTDYIVKTIENNPKASGLGINWKIYGSSGHKNKQDGLVTELFNKRSNEEHFGNTHIKTICNPRMVTKYISCHFPKYKYGTYSISPDGKRQRLWWNKKVDWSNASIHHYFCKSEEEFWIKQKRGMADRNDRYSIDRFLQYDANEVFDDEMKRYINQVKELINNN